MLSCPTILLGAALLGIWLSLFFELQLKVLCFWLLCGTLGMGLTWRHQRGLVIAAVCACAACFALYATVYPAPPHPFDFGAQPSADGAEATSWQARVVGPTIRRCLEQRCVLETRLDLLAEAQQNSWQPRAGRVFVALWDLGGPVARGDVIEVRLAVHPRRLRHAPWQLSDVEQARRRGAWRGVSVAGIHVSWHRAAGPRA